MSEAIDKPPKVFLSYSWASEDHVEWVRQLADRLRIDGVEAILDRYHLKPGQDKYVFMEQMVTDSDVAKVLVICDETYTDKANKRKGGVGTESQIISSEIYEQVNQEKFLPVIASRDENGEPYLPAFLKARMYFDLSDQQRYYEEYDRLLCNIHGKPRLAAPPVGKPPARIMEDDRLARPTEHKLRAFQDALLRDKGFRVGFAEDFLDTLEQQFEHFRITSDSGDEPFDEKVVASIEQFLPYRNDFAGFVQLVSQYGSDSAYYDLIHKFFENVSTYKFRLRHPNNPEHWTDNYRVILYELFLYLIAVLISGSKWEEVQVLLEKPYYVRTGGLHGKGALRSFDVFDSYATSLIEHRAKRLRQNGAALFSSILRKRATYEKMGMNRLAEAEAVLFLKSILTPSAGFSKMYWFPRLIAGSGLWESLELFRKAASKIYFEPLMQLFDVEGREDLNQKYEFAIKEYGLTRMSFQTSSFVDLINLKHLGTV